MQQLRKQVATHLELFDYPAMNPNCLERRDSTVAPQALHLLNNGMIHQLAEHFAERVRREAGPDRMKRVERVYWIAMSRAPSVEEKEIGVEALRRLTERWEKHLAAAKTDPDAAGRKAMATFCHAIMNSAGFLYVD